MKKFFSLVLALVMALSLTTVAWGADVTYTYDDTKTPEENYTLLKNAIEGAADGDTVYVGAGTYAGNVQINIAEKSLTVIGEDGVLVKATRNDGSGKAFYITGKDDGSAVMNVVMKNIDIEDVNPQKASIWVRENVNVTFEDVNCASIFVDNGYNQDNTVNLNIVASDIDKLSLEASVNNATNLDYDANSDLGIRVPWAGHNDRTNISVNDVTLTEGDVFTDEELQAALASDVDTIVLNFDAGEIDVPQGVTIVPNGYDVAVEAPAGSEVVLTTDGTYVVVPTVTFGDKFDLYLADKTMNAMLALEKPAVSDLTFNEVGANTNLDGSGNVAYIVANNGEYYVKTTTPTTESYAVTYAGKTTVLYYVDVADVQNANAFAYAGSATAFDKFSTFDKCGYVTVAQMPAATDVYFQTAASAALNVAYKAAATTGTDVTKNYLLDGEVVTVATTVPVVDHKFVASGYKYDTVKKINVPTSALCTKCLETSSVIYKDGKVPAGTKYYELWDGNTTTDYSVVATVAPVGGTVVTPSTDKVTSAETFDAGIAMYVGMSVMAAAGSAVVIGKKKD